MELNEKELNSVSSANKEMFEALMTVTPARLRLLARWFEQSDFLDESAGTGVQDDLRRMADLSEKALKKILKAQQCT